MIFHVIDDQPVICEFMGSVINSLGHESACFNSSMDYLDYFSEGDYKRPDAIFTDVSMPFLSGPEMVERIKSVHPDQKFVVISGRSLDKDVCNGDSCYFLNKPFGYKELENLIHSFERAA